MLVRHKRHWTVVRAKVISMANSQLIFDHSALEDRVSAWRDKNESYLPEGHLYITPNILYFLYTDEARKIYYRDGRSRIRGPGSYGIGAACVYVR